MLNESILVCSRSRLRLKRELYLSAPGPTPCLR